MKDWSPDDDLMLHLLKTLELIQCSHTVHKLEKSHVNCSIEKFTCHLMFIFSKSIKRDERVRFEAGILAKTSIMESFVSFSKTGQNQVLQAALVALGDTSTTITIAASSIISAILLFGDFSYWKPVFDALLSSVRKVTTDTPSSKRAFRGALCAFRQICIDTDGSFGSIFTRSRDIRRLISQCVYILRRKCPGTEEPILELLIEFTNMRLIEMNSFIEQGLVWALKLSKSPCLCVRVLVMKLLTSLMANNEFNLEDHIIQILRCALDAMQDNELVVSECCKFWTKQAKSDRWCEYMDVKWYHELAFHLIQTIRNTDGSPKIQRMEDDEDSSEVKVMSWVVRRCAIEAIEALCIEHEFVNELLPTIEDMIYGQTSWICKETAVLTFGIVIQNANQSMQPLFNDLFPYFVDYTEHNISMIRYAACETIGHCSYLIASNSEFVDKSLKAIVNRIADQDERVQSSACQALCDLLAHIPVKATKSFSTNIITAFQESFGIYESSNLRGLYEALGSFCTSVAKLMPPDQIQNDIIKYFSQKCKVSLAYDESTPYLLKCIRKIMEVNSFIFPAYAPKIIEFCVFMISSSNSDNNVDYTILPFQLLLLILENSTGMVSKTFNCKIVTNIVSCSFLFEHDNIVKGYTFRLLRIIATESFILLHPSLKKIIEICLEEIMDLEYSHDCEQLCTDVFRTFSVILKRSSNLELEIIANTLEPMINAATRIAMKVSHEYFNSEQMKEYAILLTANAAYFCVAQVSGIVDQYFGEICEKLCQIVDMDEKSLAVKGLIKVGRTSICHVHRYFAVFCRAALSTRDILAWNMLIFVLHEARKALEDDVWSRKIAELSPDIMITVNIILSRNPKK